MAHSEALLIAAATDGYSCDDDKRHLLGEIEAPDWAIADIDLGHWAQLVPADVRALWPQLSTESKLAAYLIAQVAVSRLDYGIDRNLND